MSWKYGCICFKPGESCPGCLGEDLPEGQETFVIDIPDRFSTAPPQTFSRVKITIDGETVFDYSNGDEEE